MTDIEERFSGNDDDGSLIERQLLSRATVKREARARPTHIAIGRFQRVVSVTRVKQKAATRWSVTADCELVCSILFMGLRRYPEQCGVR
jgi:hypothetical protein